MNPSYKNGGQDIPGVKLGIIASGPDPATPANPAVPVNPVPANPGVIASGPDPEIPEPRPITTPSGLNIAPTMPITSTNSDIMLGGDAPRSNKKGLIMGGIIAGVVALVLIVVVAMTMGKGGSTQNTSKADQNSFASYFNYLLNTDDFTVSETSEYDSSKVYGIDKAFYDKDTEYFVELGTLWNDFYTKIKEEDKYSVVSKIMGDIEYQNDLMDFITKYMASTIWDENGLLQLYVKNGLQSATAEVEKNYNALATTIYDPGKEYAEAMENNIKIYLATFAAVDSAGCITEGEINYDCMSGRITALEGVPNNGGLVGVDEELPKYVVSSLVRYGFRINEDFREEEI